MEEKKTENKETKKLSYEQLEQVANQLSEQTRKLYSKLQKSNMENVFKRLDYLFKVVENKDVFSKEFLDNCIKEIEEIIIIPEEKDNKETEESK